MPAINSEILEKLRTFDTPTICNLIELFEVRPHNTGYMDARIQACFPKMPPMVGFAATATFRSAAPPRGGNAYDALSAQVEAFDQLSGPAVVVFQDLDAPPAAATFGEVMCTIYQSFGAVGIITSGAGRDLDQVQALNFPAFTGGTICSHAYNHIPDIGVPVHVGGLTIYTNDLLHGDCNGVTTIPHEIAAEVADIGAEFMAAEGVILDALRQGAASKELLAEVRADAHRRIEKLRNQVSRAR